MLKKEIFIKLLISIHDSYVRSILFGENVFDIKLVNDVLESLCKLINADIHKMHNFMKIHQYGYKECKEFGTNYTLSKLFSDFYDSLVNKFLFNFNVAVEIENPSNTVQYICVRDLNKDKITLQRFAGIYFNFSMYEGQPALQGSNKKWHIFVTPNSYVVRQKDEDGCWDIRVFDKCEFDKLYKSLDKEHEQETVWMARDKDGSLYLYKNKPWLNTAEGIWLDWDNCYVDYKDYDMYLLQLNPNTFSYVKYGCEPIEFKVGDFNDDIKNLLNY